jgi:hypothetical protein
MLSEWLHPLSSVPVTGPFTPSTIDPFIIRLLKLGHQEKGKSMFAYIGPETILPATSLLAAIGGFLLMFGKAALRPFAVVFAKVLGKKDSPQVPDSAPAEFALPRE